nr:MAG TPA: hypothetical protein [Caudoviricetes sp.]
MSRLFILLLRISPKVEHTFSPSTEWSGGGHSWLRYCSPSAQQLCVTILDDDPVISVFPYHMT